MVSAYSKGYPSKSVNLIACIKSTTTFSHHLSCTRFSSVQPFTTFYPQTFFFFCNTVYRYVAISIVPSLTSLPCDLPTWLPAQHNAHLSSHTLILIFLSDQRFFKKKKFFLSYNPLSLMTATVSPILIFQKSIYSGTPTLSH